MNDRILGAAVAALFALTSWVFLSVQQLSVDMAVLKAQSIRSVSQLDFVELSNRATTSLDNHTRWLSRLSDRVNALETQKDVGTDP